MADEQTPTPQDPNVETTEAPALVVPPGAQPEGAPAGGPAEGQTSLDAQAQANSAAVTPQEAAQGAPTVGADLPAANVAQAPDTPPQNLEGAGPNPPPDPALAQTGADAEQAAADNPPAVEELPDPTRPIDELPVGVVVGGTPVSHRDDRPEDVPVDESAAAPGTEPRFAQPVRVDGRNRLHGDDALEGHFAKVVSGDDEGEIVAFVAVAEYSRETGRPVKVFARFKDPTYTKAYAVLDYDNIAGIPNYRGG